MKRGKGRGSRIKGIMAMVLTFSLSCLISELLPARENEFEYWPNGNVREGRKYNSEGYLSEKVTCRGDGTVECRQWFDALGHKTAEVNFDSQGKLDDNIRGWAAMRWFYKDGVVRIRTAYGEDGMLRERKVYTPGGNLIGTQYFNDESPGDQRDRFDPDKIGYGQAQYYDAAGNLIGISETEN